nr:hypothetical protein [uncultured Acetatifactor sp.]
MEEREINLIDLLVDIMLHWRGILVFMLIAGVVMGGFSYVRSGQNTGTSSPSSKGTDLKGEWENMEEYREYLEEELTEPEKVSVYSVLQSEKQYQDTLDYINHSVLMQADPQKVEKAELIFNVAAEDPGMTISLTNLYDALTTGTGFYEWLADKNDMSSFEVSELISVRRQSGILVIEGSEPEVVGKDTLKITILHADQKKCRALAESVIKYLDSQHDKLVQTVGEYEIELVDQIFSTVMDVALTNQQNSYNSTALSLMSSVASAKEAFTDDQKAFYYLMKGEDVEDSEEGEKEEETSDSETETAEPKSVRTAAPSVSLKYVILGMFLAAFVYAFVLFCRYVFNGKLRATDNLGELYGISQLGLIPGEQGKKKFLGFVDKWILSLRDRNKRKFTAAEAMELAAAAVKISAGKNMLDTVYLIGCNLKEGALELCGQVKAKLEQENIQVQVLDNVLYNSETLEQLEAAKGVVLVEKVGSTLYTEIAKELELLKRQEIQVLGGIVVE